MFIVQLSDLHFGETKSNPEVIETLIEEVNALKAQAIFVTGDVVNRGFLREYQEAERHLKKLRPKPIFIPGNHDVRRGG